VNPLFFLPLCVERRFCIRLNAYSTIREAVEKPVFPSGDIPSTTIVYSIDSSDVKNSISALPFSDSDILHKPA